MVMMQMRSSWDIVLVKQAESGGGSAGDGANKPIEAPEPCQLTLKKENRDEEHTIEHCNALLMPKIGHLGDGADAATTTLVVAPLKLGWDIDGGLGGEGGEAVHWSSGCGLGRWGTLEEAWRPFYRFWSRRWRVTKTPK